MRVAFNGLTKLVSSACYKRGSLLIKQGGCISVQRVIDVQGRVHLTVGHNCISHLLVVAR